MIQREQMLGILQSLDTGSLVKALSSVGIHVSHPAQDPNIDQTSLVGQLSEEKRPSWNELKIENVSPGKGKLELDKSFMGQAAHPMRKLERPEYLENPPETWMSMGEQQ